jgi:predicted GNAT family N-acyltransferase
MRSHESERAWRLDEQGPLTTEEWDAIVAGEEDPFGADGIDLQWRPKERFFVLRGTEGRLAAATGLVVVEVEAGGEAFPVVGVGAVIVSKSQRGRGLMRRVLDAALEAAPSLGPDRAMLFCSPANVARYARFGFREIESRVVAQQPGGPVEMPPAAMWRPLRRGAAWPAGPVRLPGLPF